MLVAQVVVIGLLGIHIGGDHAGNRFQLGTWRMALERTKTTQMAINYLGHAHAVCFGVGLRELHILPGQAYGYLGGFLFHAINSRGVWQR